MTKKWLIQDKKLPFSKTLNDFYMKITKKIYTFQWVSTYHRLIHTKLKENGFCIEYVKFFSFTFSPGHFSKSDSGFEEEYACFLKYFLPKYLDTMAFFQRIFQES